MTALAAEMPARVRLSPGLRLGLITAVLVVLVALARLSPTLHALATAPGPTEAEAARFLFWELRLPRVLAGLAAGAAFGTAGALFQAVTRNPLAAPDLLGVTAGAQIGVLLGLTVPALAAFSGPPLLFVCGLGAAALA
ncbi:MAG: iron chelate uptake ABC transporter family permease subunit, partial [Methylorubrum rhodinum]|uniref:iron chelate uptake ABC transporter family permease subunit n=1 Tax=Methylorubrum rhodinum TaxID=29428 RepID=UPI003BB031E4